MVVLSSIRAECFILVLSWFISTLNCLDYNQFDDPLAIYNEFPKSIIKFRARRDIYTNQTVSRGRLELLGGVGTGGSQGGMKVPLKEFRRILQCAPDEPGIEGQRAPISFMKVIQPSRETLELLVTRWINGCPSWLGCQETLKQWKTDSKSIQFEHVCPMNINGREFSLLRIRNGTLYADCPLSNCRFDVNFNLFYIQALVLDKISDMPDSVFFHGEEMPITDLFFPFPLLTNGPSLQSNDIAYIWPQEFDKEKDLYRHSIERESGDITPREPVFKSEPTGPESYEMWNKRIPKAMYYSSLKKIRQFVFDCANARPDLIHARWEGGDYEWTPNDIRSPDTVTMRQGYNSKNWSMFADDNNIGGLKSLWKLHDDTNSQNRPNNFKYLIVVAADNSLSGRLCHFIARSGAVVLLQTSGMEYHISARMKPWVHYVPLSYSSSDLIKKVEWLRANDELAYQIAQNAKAFGDSYLRLEDYYCYVARLQESLGEIFKQNKSADALEPYCDGEKHKIDMNWIYQH